MFKKVYSNFVFTLVIVIMLYLINLLLKRNLYDLTFITGLIFLVFGLAELIKKEGVFLTPKYALKKMNYFLPMETRVKVFGSATQHLYYNEDKPKNFYDYKTKENKATLGYNLRSSLLLKAALLFIVTLILFWVEPKVIDFSLYTANTVSKNVLIGGIISFIFVVITPITLGYLPISIIDMLRLKTKQIIFAPLIIISVTLLVNLSIVMAIILFDAYFY